MVQIGSVPEIIEVKDELQQMKEEGLIESWELPYENILTRRTAAIFFLDEKANADDIWKRLEKIPMFTYRENDEKELSQLKWRVEFNKGFEL